MQRWNMEYRWVLHPASRALLLVAGLTLGACYGASDGELIVAYTFEGGDCFDSGVDTVVIEVRESRRGRVVRTADVYCDTGETGLSFFGLSAGRYIVQIEGFDADGFLLYDNAPGESVWVDARVDQFYDIDVGGSVGDLTAFWIFEGSSWCGDVVDVRVIIEDPFGVLFEDADYPCDFGGVSYDNLIAGVWRLSLRGLGASGQVLLRADNRFLRVIAYDEVEYELNLK